MKRHKKIQHWDDERSLGNSIIVTLVNGFAFQDNNIDDAALHVRGFDTVKEAMSAVVKTKPCTCSQCRAS